MVRFRSSLMCAIMESGWSETDTQHMIDRTKARINIEVYLDEFNSFEPYWIVDPANVYLEVWTLNNGIFAKVGTFVPGDVFKSTMLCEFTIQVRDLFAI